MAETIIKIENLRKKYRLGAIGGRTLGADIQSWWAKKAGKEDPNSLIGTAPAMNKEEFWALDGINLEIKQGEALGIIGSNGAGKSTLLKILSRVTAPTEGDVYIKGQITSMLEVGTGFHSELTGRENIYMNGAILGMSKKEVDSKLEDIIAFSECAQFIDTPVKRYSSGMYVKLAFAVAAHLDSDIMVMDEVLAVGDMKFQQKCLGKMGDAANNEGKTVLYVSHNMNTIRQLCTRCVVLKKGKVIFDGDVEEAIRIYLDFDTVEYRTKYSLADTQRPSAYHGSLFRITKFEFVGKEEAVYFSNEKVIYQFSWEAYENLYDLRVYLAIKDTDDGQTVGMAQSESFGDVCANQRGTTRFSFDISNLVEGKYYFEIDVYSQNEFGVHLSYDHPRQTIVFQVIQESGLMSINWQKKYWGKIRLNKMMFLGNMSEEKLKNVKD
ncbi:MAG: ABC transporter ATP-binding protein [Blautia sp.]|nr:ABC transporter ATP-binding protein [Blautia sp.]